MGCGNSKETSNLDENQNSADPGTIVGIHPSKRDDTNLDPKIDSVSPIELVQDDQKLENMKNEPDSDVRVKKQTPIKQKKRLSIDSGVTSDAWTTGKIKTVNGEQNSNENDSDSEFGREGIDHFSSSLDGVRKKSDPAKPSPKGIQAEIQQEIYDVPRLTKKFSEEPFDPSTLIDVDKFKAVNAPKQVESKNTTHTVTIETRTTTVHSGPTTIISPSNYHEFYDEDEKALMESIEQDFTETAYSTLPGVVT